MVVIASKKVLKITWCLAESYIIFCRVAILKRKGGLDLANTGLDLANTGLDLANTGLDLAGPLKNI